MLSQLTSCLPKLWPLASAPLTLYFFGLGWSKAEPGTTKTARVRTSKLLLGET